MSSGLPLAAAMLEVQGGGKLDVIQSIFDNDGSTGPVVVMSGTGNKGQWQGVAIRHGGSTGISLEGDVHMELTDCIIKGNRGDGISTSNGARFNLTNCRVEQNQGHGVRLARGCGADIFNSHFEKNEKGVLQKEPGCNITSSSNTAVVYSPPAKQIPGFRLTMQNGERLFENSKPKTLLVTKVAPPNLSSDPVTAKQ